MSSKSSWNPASWFHNIVDDCQAAFLEFIGTTFFLTLAFGGVQAASAEAVGDTNQTVMKIMYFSASFGLALLVSAWLFFRVTGGLFNPNVTTALFLCGVIGPFRFILFCIAQLIGGIAAAALILGLTSGPLQSNVHLSPGINSAQGVFIEVFVTAALCLAVLMLAAEKHNTTPFAPVGIGLTLFVCHLFAINFTGCGMNTARAFGPAAVTGFPYGSQWVYWVGPFIGSLLAAGFYTVLKHFHSWELNPDQDAVDHRESPDDPVNIAEKSTTENANRHRGANDSPV